MSWRLLVLFFTCPGVLISNITHAQPSRPLFIIPGILGSKLCDRSTNNVVWGDRLSLFRFTQLKLPTNYEPDNLPHTACGIIDSIQILGPWRSHQYDRLKTYLGSLGYKEGRDLFFFDYDWRLSNRFTARKLQTFIAAHAPTGQIDIVAHSMGGIVARLYIQELGGGARVNRFLTMGTPHLGAANVFKTLDEGWSWYENLMAHGVTGIRTTALSFPAMLELLPGYPKCCAWRQPTGSAVEYFDPFDFKVWQRFSWMPSDVRAGGDGNRFSRDLSEAKSIHNVLAQPLPATIRHVNIATSLIPTAWRVVAQPADGKIVEFLTWPGDGTVMDFSASNGANSDARPSSSEHARIFADSAAEQVVRWVLREDTIPTAGVLRDFQASLRAADGSLQKITGVSYEAPSALIIGEKGVFTVEISGEASLGDADLSNVTAAVDTTQSTLRVSRRRDRRESNGSITVTLEMEFTAPPMEGVHSISLSLPGVSELQDYFLVVGTGQIPR